MKKPILSFWQIWNMSVGFFGIQFGFGLQNANVSRIFQTLGADIDLIPILWIAAPVTGLIIQPIVGHMSDNTWGKFGRRRPYFLIGALLASISLAIMPNSPVLWVAAGMLWIMDASMNITMEPFRAFVGDMLPPKQRTSGFAMQSFFIGTGAVIASALPYILSNWLGVSNVADQDNLIPPSVKYSFYLGGMVFLLSVLWTVFKTKEYSPEELLAFEKAERAEIGLSGKAYSPVSPRYSKTGLAWLLISLILTTAVYYFSLESKLYIISLGVGIVGVIILIAGKLHAASGLSSIITDLFNMPKTMKQLAVVQFFSWLALFSMWIFSTPGVTQHIYGTSDTTSKLYNDGAEWVGVLFGIYNGVAALFAFLLPVFAKKSSRKITHAICLSIGGIGLASFYIIPDPLLLIIPTIGIGFAWASILTMPYAILTDSLPAERVGTFMGIFNLFIVIPQIMAAGILGLLVNTLFKGESILALVFGGCSMVVAAISVLLVNDRQFKT
jgi:maltose/moltooligosaccharide transporter